MSTTYFVAGSVFLLLSGIAAFYKWRAKKNKKFEEAETDAKSAVDRHDTGALFDALRRMRQNR